MHPSRIQRYLPAILTVAAIAYGVTTAIQRRWVCDDAFISYRYAQNMLEGRGLVYNEGEYVEGYSNFLWTMLVAAGMAIGASAEMWSVAWGILFFAGSLALLAWHFRILKKITNGACGAIPVAVILAAVHQDWTIYATSGLETSAYTFFLVLGYVLLVRYISESTESTRESSPRVFLIGFVFAAAALTRPDGALFAMIAGAILLVLPHTRRRPLVFFIVGFGIPFTAFMIWKKWYYGEWLPNTYYAKSAHLPWWEQGWHYLGLYFRKYFILLAAIPALAIPLVRRSQINGDPTARALGRIALVAAAFAFPYTLYIARLGGDFMYARMLIPAAPFFMLLIEIGVSSIPWPVWGRLPAGALLVAILVAALLLPPFPMTGFDRPHGIANEWKFYREARPLLDESKDHQAALLKKYCAGLPIHMAFLGAEAHAMYRARIPVAIEAEAGLTDRFIARQSLTARGRVGHEKNAPLSYLLERKVHLTLSPEAPKVLKLTREMLERPILLDGVLGWVLTWDPQIMDEIKRRGARFLDIPREVDALISQLPRMTDEQVRGAYAQFSHIYFNHVSDPARESPIRAKLGLPPRS